MNGILEPSGEPPVVEPGRIARRLDRLFWAGVGSVLGFCGLYVLALLGLPGPVYHPIERFWSFSPKDSGLGMLYFRQLGWGLVGALAGALVGALVGARLGGRTDGESQASLPAVQTGWLLLGWGMVAVGVMVVYSVIQAFGV